MEEKLLQLIELDGGWHGVSPTRGRRENVMKEKNRRFEWFMVLLNMAGALYFFGRLITYAVQDRPGMMLLDAALVAAYVGLTARWIKLL